MKLCLLFLILFFSTVSNAQLTEADFILTDQGVRTTGRYSVGTIEIAPGDENSGGTVSPGQAFDLAIPVRANASDDDLASGFVSLMIYILNVDVEGYSRYHCLTYSQQDFLENRSRLIDYSIVMRLPGISVHFEV